MSTRPRRCLTQACSSPSESGRQIQMDLLPALSSISVVTMGELHAGVLAAVDTATRARSTLDPRGRFGCRGATHHGRGSSSMGGVESACG